MSDSWDCWYFINLAFVELDFFKQLIVDLPSIRLTIRLTDSIQRLTYSSANSACSSASENEVAITAQQLIPYSS